MKNLHLSVGRELKKSREKLAVNDVAPMIALSDALLAAVRELDQTAFNEIEESPLPAFLKLDPPNCAACHLFNPFWASWAEAADNMGLEGRVWRVDCGVHQACLLYTSPSPRDS